MSKKLTWICNGKKIECTPLPSDADDGDSQKKSSVSTPGRGSFTISDLVLSNDSISEGESLTCKTTIKGKNISQIAIEVMLQVNNFKVGPIQHEYLHALKNREIKGVVHPHWEEENEIEFEIIPESRLLCCGECFTIACMTPERYGVEPEAQIWNLEGIYQRGGGEPFRVKLEFDNQGALVRKTGFYPALAGGVVSPFELLIEDGDTFEPYVTMINEKGELSTGSVNPIMLGGGNLLHWEQIYVCPGTYHIGLAIEDFDGQKTRVYTDFTINN
ncbi:MAG: peptidase C11 clostripain [uncultured bacterium]|nr:MAG: peptidase C11 clostripain [uncultured bacterium]